MAGHGLGRTKSLNKLRPIPRIPQYPFVPDLDVLENRLVRSGTPNFSRTAKFPEFVIRESHDQDTQRRPQTANPTMDRRKDLMAMGSPIMVTSGEQKFHFPTPSRRQSMVQNSHNPELRSDTPDTPDTIGVAIGSPTNAFFHSPMFESPYQNSLAAPNDVFTPLSTPGRSMNSYEIPNTRNDMYEAPRPKLSRWRSLGGLFGRKQAQERREKKPSPLVQQKSPAPVDLKLNGNHPWEKDSASRVIFHAQTPPLPSKKTKRARMGIGRAQTAPTGRRMKSPVPPPKGPMLDVHIPETQMERYSVMFSQKPSQENSQSQSGLLARRQASVRRQSNMPKQVESPQPLELPLPPKLRQTSAPEPSPSYTLRLFPSERNCSPKPSPLPHISTLHRPRPLLRANTAPGTLSPGLKDKQSGAGDPSPLSTMSEMEEDLMEDNRQTLTPTLSQPSTPTDAHSVHSFRTLAANRASTATTWDPALTEPSWEMITIGKMPEPGDRFSDAAKFAASKVRVRSNSDEKDEDWHHDGKSVVQVARSISVTKARRQIFGPKRVDARRPQIKRVDGQQVVGPHKVELVRKDGGTERFVERKPLTPNVVQLVEMSTAANRKSVRVILEDA